MNASLAEPIEQAATQSANGCDDEVLVKRDLAVLGHVAVRLEVVLGRANMTVEELFGLKPGNCLPLDTTLDAPVALHLNGKMIASGHLVAVDDHFGIKIVDVA